MSERSESGTVNNVSSLFPHLPEENWAELERRVVKYRLRGLTDQLEFNDVPPVYYDYQWSYIWRQGLENALRVVNGIIAKLNRRRFSLLSNDDFESYHGDSVLEDSFKLLKFPESS